MSLARHFLALFSGRLISQATLVISTPILTRVFEPEHFGVVSLAGSLVQVPLLVMMGRLEMGITQGRDDAEAGRLVLLCLLLGGVTTALCLLAALLLGDWLGDHYGSPSLPLVLLAMVLLFVPQGLMRIGKQWAAYRERHGIIASADVVQTQFRRWLPLPLVPLAGAGPWPLVAGQAVGALSAAAVFFGKLRRDIGPHLHGTRAELKATFQHYKGFTVFLGSASIIETGAWSLLFMFISEFFGVTALGWFTHAHALLFLPIALLNHSATNIFYPRMAKAREDAAALQALMERILSLSFDLGLYPLLVLVPLAPYLWAVALGEAFAPSGWIAQLMIPMALSNLLYSPLSVSVNVLHKQRPFFWQTLALNVGRVGGLLAGCLAGDLAWAIGLYAAVTSVGRVAQIAWMLTLTESSAARALQGAMPKALYTAAAVGVTYALLASASLWVACAVAALGGLGWVWLITRHNPDAAALVGRITRRLRG